MLEEAVKVMSRMWKKKCGTKKRRRSSKQPQSEAFKWLQEQKSEEKKAAAQRHTEQMGILRGLVAAVERLSDE